VAKYGLDAQGSVREEIRPFGEEGPVKRMLSNLQGELILALAFLVVFTFAAWIASDLPRRGGTFAKFTAYSGLALSLLHLGFYAARRVKEVDKSSEYSAVRILASLAVVIVYLFLVVHLGFVMISVAFVGLYVGIARRRVRTALAAALVVVVFVLALRIWLGLELPRGPLDDMLPFL
jgi:hypothetical protein